jgi:hypothetical protein
LTSGFYAYQWPSKKLNKEAKPFIWSNEKRAKETQKMPQEKR